MAWFWMTFFFRLLFWHFLFNFMIKVSVFPDTLLLNLAILCDYFTKSLLLAIDPVSDILFTGSIMEDSMILFFSIQVTSFVFRSIFPRVGSLPMHLTVFPWPVIAWSIQKLQLPLTLWDKEVPVYFSEILSAVFVKNMCPSCK